jgi:hypothetical protein
LQLATGAKFIMLDASATLGGLEWSDEARESFDKPFIHYHSRGGAAYMEAVIDAPGPFEPWLHSVAALPQSAFDQLISLIPSDDWKQTEDDLRLVHTLLSRGEEFADRFRAMVEEEWNEL